MFWPWISLTILFWGIHALVWATIPPRIARQMRRKPWSAEELERQRLYHDTHPAYLSRLTHGFKIKAHDDPTYLPRMQRWSLIAAAVFLVVGGTACVLTFAV